MKILFMCVANSARSQLAEGLARRMFPDAEVQSAGSRPGRLNSHAVAVMKEIGLDISHQFSKSTDDLPREFLADLDFVITLCAEEVCPVMISRARKLHWPLTDPAPPAAGAALTEAEALQRFRTARDLIAQRLKTFHLELCP